MNKYFNKYAPLQRFAQIFACSMNITQIYVQGGGYRKQKGKPALKRGPGAGALAVSQAFGPTIKSAKTKI